MLGPINITRVNRLGSKNTNIKIRVYMIIRNYKEPTGVPIGTGTSTKDFLALPETKNNQLINSVFKCIEEHKNTSLDDICEV